MGRLAAAPISWGICEVPGWGLQLPPRRVLGEMHQLGIAATELGSLGWLPTDASELRALLAEYELQLVGGFVPLVLHDPTARDAMLTSARAAARTLADGGGTCFVTAAVSSPESWERPEMSADAWTSVFTSLALLDELCAEHELTQVVHPHVNTLIEKASEVERFLDHTSTKFCLDTGHLFIGGSDPVDLARRYLDRVGLVHVKDVDRRVADRLSTCELTLMTATQAGLFPAAGSGDVPIGATLELLLQSVYNGWYVMEQDVALDPGDEPEIGSGPVLGVRASIEYLRSLAP